MRGAGRRGARGTGVGPGGSGRRLAGTRRGGRHLQGQPRRGLPERAGRDGLPGRGLAQGRESAAGGRRTGGGDGARALRGGAGPAAATPARHSLRRRGAALSLPRRGAGAPGEHRRRRQHRGGDPPHLGAPGKRCGGRGSRGAPDRTTSRRRLGSPDRAARTLGGTGPARLARHGGRGDAPRATRPVRAAARRLRVGARRALADRGPGAFLDPDRDRCPGGLPVVRPRQRRAAPGGRGAALLGPAGARGRARQGARAPGDGARRPGRLRRRPHKRALRFDGPPAPACPLPRRRPLRGEPWS